MRRERVTVHTTNTTSRPEQLLCPACACGELQPMRLFTHLARCDSCGYAFNVAIVRTLQQIVSLPDALGKHACEECSHPEMRWLPDGVFHCPACRSEVLYIGFISPSLHEYCREERYSSRREC